MLLMSWLSLWNFPALCCTILNPDKLRMKGLDLCRFSIVSCVLTELKMTDLFHFDRSRSFYLCRTWQEYQISKIDDRELHVLEAVTLLLENYQHLARFRCEQLIRMAAKT